MILLRPVLLSGGSGTRLWPLSREAYPKQFLPLVGEDTMLQATWLRVGTACRRAPPIVVANEEHRFLVAEQLRAGRCAGAARSCSSRSAATPRPAIAVAALQALADGGDPLLLVLPSDHVIADVDAFRAAVRAASAGRAKPARWSPSASCRRRRKPATATSKPTATRRRRARGRSASSRSPTRATAQRYVDAGGYYWNSGMFLFRASRYLEELGALPSRHRRRRAAPRSTQAQPRRRLRAPGQATPSPPARRIRSTTR